MQRFLIYLFLRTLYMFQAVPPPIIRNKQLYKQKNINLVLRLVVHILTTRLYWLSVSVYHSIIPNYSQQNLCMFFHTIPNYSQQDATFLELFISKDAVHVSGGSSAHHQDHTTVQTELRSTSSTVAASSSIGWQFLKLNTTSKQSADVEARGQTTKHYMNQVVAHKQQLRIPLMMGW